MNGRGGNPAKEAEIAAALARAVPAWQRARQKALKQEAKIARLGRELAAARGESFIRFERLEAEFGGK